METVKRYVIVIGCVLVAICNGCIVVTTGPRKPVEPFVSQQSAKPVEAGVNENQTAASQPETQGSGYLSSGSTVSVGLLDGDEELKIFEKIKKLEKSLEREKEMRETLEQDLTDATIDKEKIKDECVTAKRELEEEGKNLREEIEILEANIADLERKLAAAELRPKLLEEQLIEAQIAETKARQELFKLKIDQLEKGEE